MVVCGNGGVVWQWCVMVMMVMYIVSFMLLTEFLFSGISRCICESVSCFMFL